MRSSMFEGYHATCEMHCDSLPSLGVIFAEARAEVLVPAGVEFISILAHVNLVWILFEVGDVMCSMSALEDGIGGLGLLLTLPQEMLTKTDSKLGSEHVATGGARRESELWVVSVGGGVDDRLWCRAS